MIRKAFGNLILLSKVNKMLSFITNKIISICGAFLLSLQKFKKYVNDVSPLAF